MADKDLDLEVKANSVWDYINENRKAKDIFVWTWENFLSQKGKRIGLWIVFLVFASSLAGVVKSYATKDMINGLLPTLSKVADPWQVFLRGFVFFAVLLCGGRVINWIKNHLQEYFFDDFGRELSSRVTSLFFEKSLGQHISENTVLNADNVKKGYERAKDLVNNIVLELPEQILAVMLPFIMLWFMDKSIALMMSVMMIFHIGLSGYLNYRAMVEGYPIERLWRTWYRYMSERWRNIERVKSNAKEKNELLSLGGKYNKASELDLKLWLSYVFWSFIRGLICCLMALSAIYYGGYAIRSGKLSIGWISPMITLILQILDNLWQIGNIERKIHYNLHSVGIIREALALPSGIVVVNNPVCLPRNSPCRIEFDSISHRFGNDEKLPMVLNNVSFTIEPNENVALIGTSGAGKSTLMKLLLRYMDPVSGSIRIDGVDLKDIDLDSWLNLVGYIPQQAQILNGTIRYNTLYGVPTDVASGITDEYIWEQMRLLQVDFGNRLVDGLDTRLGYNGIELSGGQNQRLMILAAAMKNPRFMIIDEATSSLDSSTEKLVQIGLEKVLSRNCGALIVAHRLSTIRRICDKFVVIDSSNGCGSGIVGAGNSFEELADTCPQFIRLAHDQEIAI